MFSLPNVLIVTMYFLILLIFLYSHAHTQSQTTHTLKHNYVTTSLLIDLSLIQTRCLLATFPLRIELVRAYLSATANSDCINNCQLSSKWADESRAQGHGYMLCEEESTYILAAVSVMIAFLFPIFSLIYDSFLVMSSVFFTMFFFSVICLSYDCFYNLSITIDFLFSNLSFD